MDTKTLVDLLGNGGFALVAIAVLFFVVRYFMQFVNQQREDLAKQREVFTNLIENHLSQVSKDLQMLTDRIEQSLKR